MIVFHWPDYVPTFVRCRGLGRTFHFVRWARSLVRFRIFPIVGNAQPGRFLIFTAEDARSSRYKIHIIDSYIISRGVSSVHSDDGGAISVGSETLLCHAFLPIISSLT